MHQHQVNQHIVTHLLFILYNIHLYIVYFTYKFKIIRKNVVIFNFFFYEL